jgi:hypothetical protein
MIAARTDRLPGIPLSAAGRALGRDKRRRGALMAKLIYSAIASADGYIEDANGKFDDWAAPDDELLSFVNDLERPVGTYLYGRRMYQTMPIGRPPTRYPANRPACRTSRASGRPPTRSCSPRRWPRCPA